MMNSSMRHAEDSSNGQEWQSKHTRVSPMEGSEPTMTDVHHSSMETMEGIEISYELDTPEAKQAEETKDVGGEDYVSGGIAPNDVSTNEEDAQEEPSETAQLEQEITEARDATHRDAAERLESILNDIKVSTKVLLGEIKVYLETTESVTVDYVRCQASQRNEANRLEAVEPDVTGATARFLQQAQEQISMMGSTVVSERILAGGERK
eukprot:scaffold178854_cov58-Attheya_sp.AAC.6